MAAHLSYGRVNLNILREVARKDLREFLDKCAGSKVMQTQHVKHGRPSDSYAHRSVQLVFCSCQWSTPLAKYIQVILRNSYEF